MKKSSLKTTTIYDAPNAGDANERASRTSPTSTSKNTYDSTQWTLNADSNQGVGTANSRYATSTPRGSQPQGQSQPQTSHPMINDISLIGPGVLTSSTPARKRRG